jgi:hypothetical protein
MDPPSLVVDAVVDAEPDFFAIDFPALAGVSTPEQRVLI